MENGKSVGAGRYWGLKDWTGKWIKADQNMNKFLHRDRKTKVLLGPDQKTKTAAFSGLKNMVGLSELRVNWVISFKFC